MREIEGWLTLIGSSHTMIHTKQARPGKKTEFFYKLFTSSRTVKHSNLNSALGKRMLLRILKKETSGRDIFCLQAPIIILSHMSRTRLIWSYLSKKVCTSGWLYIEKFKKIVHLYLRLFDRLTWEVSCNAFDKRCVTSERKSPYFSNFRFSHAWDVICPNMSLSDRLGLFAELATDHYQRFLIMAQAHELPFAIANILSPNFPHPSRLSQTPVSRVLYVKPLTKESWQQVTQSSCHQENRYDEADCCFERGFRHVCTLCKHNVYVISGHETRKQPENSLPEELQTG